MTLKQRLEHVKTQFPAASVKLSSGSAAGDRCECPPQSDTRIYNRV